MSSSDSDLSLSNEKLPNSFSISVIMESQPSTHPWADVVWDARGIVAIVDGLDNSYLESSIKDGTDKDGTDNGSNDKESIGKKSAIKNDVKVIEQGDVKQFIYSGLKIRLFLDECESYYHNMMSPEPGCFIVAYTEDKDGNDTDVPIPVMVTLSFDEAHSYLEGGATVYAVPIPAELYRWTEAYVLENYVSEKRIKRKRVDWKKGDKRNSSSHEPAFDGSSPENKGKSGA